MVTYDLFLDYHLSIISGPLEGLLARCVIVLNKEHHIFYQEFCNDITTSPNIERAIEALKQAT